MAAELKGLKPELAIAALKRRGLNLDPSFSWQDIYGELHGQMFTVAKSTGYDILDDIFKALLKALSEGRTYEQFARELTPLLQQKGWWGRQLVEDPMTGQMEPAQLGSAKRLQIIFDANMRVSYAAGHWSNFERNKSTRPYLRYVTMHDDVVRPEHAARHNLVLPVDHPYWNKWAAPCGWRCRCTMQSLSEREIRQLQAEGEILIFEPPADVLVPWTNKRTGEVRQIPKGIDPGWDHNPGKSGFMATEVQIQAKNAGRDISP